jgi:hypothetical protein
MKNLYRCEINLTDEEFKNTPTSNIFFRADTAENAAVGAKELFNKALIENKIENAKFKIEVFLSSQEEVEQYRQQMNYRRN